MIRNMTLKPTYLPILMLISLAILVISCGGEKGSNPEDTEYTLNGVLFYNADNSSSLFYVKVCQNGIDLSGVTVRVEGMTIPYAGDGVYSATSPGLQLSPGDTHTVTVSLGDTLQLFFKDLVLPDTFSVEVTDPASHAYYGSGFISLEWTGSAGSKGYIVTVVRPDSSLTAAPFANYVELVTATQIGPEAFQKSDGTDVDGDYDIYVLSFSTENFYSWPTIFFPLPQPAPAGNIKTDRVSGSFGVGTLSKGDYITVTYSR
ncbi:MAG: hypothetical protein KKG33_10580 [candidate division Zixibacteria bacterium]|nr:hypothetical protein [candidate division Zixibacteria bacterium]